MAASVIEIASVSFSYSAELSVFRNLCLKVTARRRTAVLGANGSGKSTLLQVINGTLRPSQGIVRINGRAITYSRADLAALRKTVGIVLQDPDDQLFAPTVEQDVAFGLLNSGVSPEQARHMVHSTLRAMGIEKLSRRGIYELSPGEKKRVAIAGVIVLDPKLVLLDEPTAGLDATGIRSLLTVLDQLHARGTTLVVTTHDNDFALEWADDAAVLANGAVQTQGAVADVLLQEQIVGQANLDMPLILQAAMRCHSLRPSLATQPMPRTRAELLEFLELALR